MQKKADSGCPTEKKEIQKKQENAKHYWFKFLYWK